MVVAEGGAIYIGCALRLPKRSIYSNRTVIQLQNYLQQYSQKNFMRIIGNDQKNDGQNFWEILERIICKISRIIGAGLTTANNEASLNQWMNKESRFNVTSLP